MRQNVKYCRKKTFFNAAGFLDQSLESDNFVCSMSRLASWFLLRKITRYTNVFYLCICQTKGKLQRNIYGVVYFVALHTSAYVKLITKILREIEQSDLTKMLFAALNEKKGSHNNNERKSAFKQLRLNYTNNNNKKQTKKNT